MNTEQTPLVADTEPTHPIAPGTSPAADAGAMASAPPPRIRWAAIVWGAVFAIIAWTGIWMLSSADRRSGISDWFAALSPGTVTALALLSIGVLVLVAGLVGLIRRLQKRGTAPDPDAG